MKTPTRILLGLAAACVTLAALGIDFADGQATSADPPLPTNTIVVDAPESALYRIAVPDLLGTAGLGAQGSGVLRNDFALVSLFKVLDPASFVANLQAEGMNITPNSWQTVGAQGFIKGDIKQSGGKISVNMHLY